MATGYSKENPFYLRPDGTYSAPYDSAQGGTAQPAPMQSNDSVGSSAQQAAAIFNQLGALRGDDTDESDYNSTIGTFDEQVQAALNGDDPELKQAVLERLSSWTPDRGMFTSGQSGWNVYNKYVGMAKDAKQQSASAAQQPIADLKAVLNDPNSTPEQRQAALNSLQQQTSLTPGDDYLQWGTQQAAINSALHQGQYDQYVNPALDSVISQINGAQGVKEQEAANLDRSADTLKGTLSGLNKQVTSNANSTNSNALAAIDRIRGLTNSTNTAAQGNLSTYLGETDPLMAARQGAGWGADVSADAEGIGLQRTALGNISQDLKTGGANQQAALDAIINEAKSGGANQQQVFDKYWGLSDPTVTAKERFAFEQLRNATESRDKSIRDATADALARRGLRSGALQVGQAAAAQQQNGQQGVLGELGIQAQAVDRAMAALQGAGTTATQLRSGNQNALGLETSAATGLRNSNQNAMGLQLSGANAMRTANDALTMFNKSGSQAAAQWQDSVAMQEASRVGNLAGQRSDARTSTLDSNFNRSLGTENTALDVNNQNYGRTNDALTYSTGTAKDLYGVDTDTANRHTTVADAGVTSAKDVADTQKSRVADESTIRNEPIDKIIDMLSKKQAADLAQPS